MTEALENSGFEVTKYDLTKATIPYWYLRSQHNESKGIVEPEFVAAYESGKMKYIFITARKTDGNAKQYSTIDP